MLLHNSLYLAFSLYYEIVWFITESQTFLDLLHLYIYVCKFCGLSWKIRITLHLAKDKSNVYSTVSSSCIFTVSCTSVKSHLHRKFLHRHLHISCPVILFRYTIVLPRDGLWGARWKRNLEWNNKGFTRQGEPL